MLHVVLILSLAISAHFVKIKHLLNGTAILETAPPQLITICGFLLSQVRESSVEAFDRWGLGYGLRKTVIHEYVSTYAALIQSVVACHVSASRIQDMGMVSGH